jgi:1-acyl-sn-glycerol-3-phosphate acyltransferase
MSALRSLLFALYQMILTAIYATLVLLLFWLPPLPRFRFITGWCLLNLVGARLICGIRHRVIGAENIPPRADPHLVMSKHSSTWETLSLNFLFPPLAFVAKKELLSIPFFGWAFTLASPITIDRKAGHDAMTPACHAGPRALAPGFLDRRLPGRHADQGRHARALQERRRAPGDRAWHPYRSGGA